MNIGTKQHFATSWGGLAHRERRIPLRYGEILINGYNATITISKGGRLVAGDVAKVNAFIKTFFLTGGRINGRRMTSQQIISYILGKLPGSFTIVA